MVWVLMWVQLISGHSLDHIHLATYYKKAECYEQLKKAEVMKSHNGIGITCLEINLEGIEENVRNTYRD